MPRQPFEIVIAQSLFFVQFFDYSSSGTFEAVKQLFFNIHNKGNKNK